MNNLLDGKVEGEALAVVVALVLGVKVVEVKVWVGYGANFVRFGLNAVAGWIVRSFVYSAGVMA